MIKIGYEAGHGYSTPGKRTPIGEREWSFNNKVALSFAKELSQYNGVIIKRFDDPTGVKDIPLRERTNGANQWKANYYISFHHNAFLSSWGSHTGVETFVYTSPKQSSLELANAIHPAVVAAYNLRDRGIKRGNLHIVRETTMPAILIEGGFMDSTIDILKLRDDRILEQVGKSVAQSLAKFLGLSKAVKEQTNKDETYEVLISLNGYNTALDAKNHKNSNSTVKNGTYFIYKRANGMLNVTTQKGIAGSWINPGDNVEG